jgi:hypothetical protein
VDIKAVHSRRRSTDTEGRENAAMLNPKILEAWRAAPRLNAFAAFFEETARGEANLPDLAVPVADAALLGFDLDCMIFWDSHRRLWGSFDRHYFASIPFRLEEECRLGASIFTFASARWAREGRPATIYTLGAGAGTLARTLAKFGDGRLRTLSCSPTAANKASFFAHGADDNAHFYHGPFFELDEVRYASDPQLWPFRDGYDILLEDTSFQMYGPERKEQLSIVAPRIRPDGLLIQVQKLNQTDRAEYRRRERQKDADFKTRYFSDNQIADKRRTVLNLMESQQVELAPSIEALQEYFSWTLVTWNSGNFYTLISSNSASAIKAFVTSLLPPAIPDPYCYEHLPLGFDRGEPFAVTSRWRWRDPEPVLPKPAMPSTNPTSP